MNATKSTGVAYALWFFLGGVGAHKFYLGRAGIGVLYIGMFVLFWTGMLTLSAVALEASNTVLAVQQAHPGLIENGWHPGIMSLGMIAPAMIAPLSLALLYDLITLPSQVRAANAGRASQTQQTFGASSAGSMFGNVDRDEELAARKADEVVARYIARQPQSSAPTRAAPGAHAGTPTFGRRGR